VIGRNGAGKSTLLKILSRISPPTEGRARVRGRVGTLLEVGTGFHPELTGRDNIFLSGTILGMSRVEVAHKFDQIVAFSEIDDFVDTPVKRYSSGMYVRLAFAVASFLEPEILIVDEVLAVGDASFQRKSLGRLNEASEEEGRTVLFVSHNLQAIRTFCKRVMVLDRGSLVFDGAVEQGLERYLRALPTNLDLRGSSERDRLNRANGAARLTQISARNADGKETWTFRPGEAAILRFGYEVLKRVPDMAFLVSLRCAHDGRIVTAIREIVSHGPLDTGEAGTVELIFPSLSLRPGEISIRADLLRVDDTVGYDVVDANVDLPLLMVVSDSTDKYGRQGLVSLDHQWRCIRAENAKTSAPEQEVQS